MFQVKRNHCGHQCSVTLNKPGSGFSSCPQLPNEEEPEGGPQVAADAPPPYSSIAVDNVGKAITHPDVSLLLRSFAVVAYWGIVFVLVCAVWAFDTDIFITAVYS